MSHRGADDVTAYLPDRVELVQELLCHIPVLSQSVAKARTRAPDLQARRYDCL